MRVHFIAIGGAAMHNLALALHHKGYQVTGSDDEIFDPSKSRLQKYGLLPEKYGWFPKKITPDIDAVILGMHAKEDNPELKKARELDLNIYSYPEYLYLQSQDKKRVVVAGSHGKTTITSMILHVLAQTGKEVNYMVGSQLKGFETMVKLDDNNDTIILEGDEYLSSPLDERPKFWLYRPHLTVISGIAWDHMNKFPDKQVYNNLFAEYINLIEEGGTLIYNEEDKVLKEIVDNSTRNINKIAYKTPNYSKEDGHFYLIRNEQKIPLQIFGAHNMQNMEAARKICNELGIDDDVFYQAMQSFKGADKRLEKIFENKHTIIFKDFAHAPSKVQASLKAVKETYPDKKVIAVLELHTYSSLNQKFLPEYKDKLNEADEAIVFYSPKAVAIKKLEPIPPELILKEFNRPDLKVFTEPEKLHKYLYDKDLKNSVLLFMSSGNYGGLNFKQLMKG
jgi:UDP-N-acetylmuramate: L-alanyl-gamma-D-glutamyl-meso-diaminopimelate ligase